MLISVCSASQRTQPATSTVLCIPSEVSWVLAEWRGLVEGLELFMGTDGWVEGVPPQVSDLVWFPIEALSRDAPPVGWRTLLSCGKLVSQSS